jgi:hypothetical protein
MYDILKWIFIVLIILGVFFLVWGLTHKNNLTGSSSSREELKQLGVFKTCKTNFECDLGFFCEFRDHPTVGICVIAPGGACHKNSDKPDICYSGYYCDAQDGTCLKK